MEYAEIAVDKSRFKLRAAVSGVLCARCRPQMNTLKFYTQEEVSAVPCLPLFKPGPVFGYLLT